ncbi:MAG: hypothetical protein H7288_21925 [Kineosporiaceae bacterium]|nr:hypothetical protein [Aeromicrobium sp.]
MVTFQTHNPSRDTLVWAIVGGPIVTLATLALGIVFGATRRALWLWLAIPSVSFAQIVGQLVFVESTAASDASGADLSVGVGALFLSSPIFLAVLIFIWVGTGLGV